MRENIRLITIGVLALILLVLFARAVTVGATVDECGEEFTYIVTPENDGDGATVTDPFSDSRVAVDIQDFDNDDDRRVVINPDTGYKLTFIGVDYSGNNDNEATPSVGNGTDTITYTAPDNQGIDRVTVKLVKVCPATSSPTPTQTATATPTATPQPTINPCDGQCPTATPEVTSTPGPSVTPAPKDPPEKSDPCFYFKDNAGRPECATKSEVFPGEGSKVGPQK